MSLRIIYGRAGSGKTRFCMQNIYNSLKDTDSRLQILLVPEQFTHQAEKNLISLFGSLGIDRVDVMSFKKLARKCIKEITPTTKKHINKAARCIMLTSIMQTIEPKLMLYKDACKKEGFIQKISDTITEMKRYNITIDTIANIINSDIDTYLKSKLCDIKLIYEEFEKRLHLGYIDSEDDLAILAKNLCKMQSLEDAEIWIDAFSGFTPSEYAIIRELLLKVKRVNITLCTDCLIDEYTVCDTDVFFTTKKTAARLEKIAKEFSIPIEPVVSLNERIPYRFLESDELFHLERNLFSYPYKSFKKNTEDIKIFIAKNPYSEVDECARSIVALCRDHGLRYRDIVVGVRDIASYEGLIAAIFESYDIPYFIDDRKKLDSNPLIVMLLSLFSIHKSNYSYESVFTYLKTGFCDVQKQDIDRLENHVLQWRIRGSMWKDDKRWQDKKLSSIKDCVMAPLWSFFEGMQGKMNSRLFCTKLYRFLCDMKIPEKIEKKIEEFKSIGELSLASMYSQIWNIIIDVLDQIVEVMGDEECDIEYFSKLLASAISEYKLSIIPPGLDQVTIGSIERQRSHDICAMFVLGVCDGVFPAVFNDEGILSDRDRKTLLNLGLELADDTLKKAFFEQYLIYTTLLMPSKYLHLSFPSADVDGKSLRSSIIISRVKKLFPNITQYSDIIEKTNENEEISLIASPSATLNTLIGSIRRLSNDKKNQSLWWDVYNWYTQNEEWNERLKIALSGFSYVNTVMPLCSQKAKKLYGTPLRSSISKLERYASCPFSYFIQYGLKANERKIFSISPPDIGTFLHKIIDDVSKDLKKDKKTFRDIDETYCTDTVTRAIDGLLSDSKNSLFNVSARYTHLAKRLKRVLVRTIMTIAEHIKLSDFEPLAYELAFGIDGDLPSIEIIKKDGEKIILEGRIDRIDIMENEGKKYIRVIDYKSGNKDFDITGLYHGLELQLAIYLDATISLLSKKEGEVFPAGMLYMKIDEPYVSKREIKDQKELEDEIKKQLKMKGLLVSDVSLILSMHKGLEGYSHIIPVNIKKDGSLGDKSQVASADQFKLLLNHAKGLLNKMGEELFSGEIGIRPVLRKRVAACENCKFQSICQIEANTGDMVYKNIKELDNETVWKLIRNGSDKDEAK